MVKTALWCPLDWLTACSKYHFNVKTVATSLRRQEQSAKACRNFSPVRYRAHELPVSRAWFLRQWPEPEVGGGLHLLTHRWRLAISGSVNWFVVTCFIWLAELVLIWAFVVLYGLYTIPPKVINHKMKHLEDKYLIWSLLLCNTCFNKAGVTS